MERSVGFPVERAAAIPAEFVRNVFGWMFALYLDFVNLFLPLLNLFGKRR